MATRSNGSAVEDLTPGELRLFDNDREQAITSFERVRASAVGAKRTGQAGPPSRRADRLSVILLDALNTEWSDQIYARRAAADVLEQIPAGERLAIFALSDRLRLLHDFSSDAAALKALVERFPERRHGINSSLQGTRLQPSSHTPTWYVPGCRVRDRGRRSNSGGEFWIRSRRSRPWLT